MAILPLTRMWERVDRARQDGNTTVFLELLYLGELTLKLCTAAVLSTVSEDRERHRYRQMHRLVRADGLGEWPLVLDEVLTGPTSQHIVPGGREIQKQLTERTGPPAWQYEASALLDRCLRLLEARADEPGAKADARRWFVAFTALRNRTRGHGAVRPDQAGELCTHLERSLHLVIDNLAVFELEWAFLYRNLNRRYRVTTLADQSASVFDYLKTTTSSNFTDGVYISVGELRRVDLLYSDPEAMDFFLPNGGFSPKRFEVISYITGTTRDEDTGPFLEPATPLPASETEGQRQLGVVSECFTNLPPRPADYVARPGVEEELKRLLLDDRHPIVTLAGRGGIGKTSVALSVLYQLLQSDRFSVIAWLSARDIDLLAGGPKPVRPQVLTTLDMAKDVVALLEPAEAKEKGFKSVDYFAAVLTRSDVGPILFVMDNFETMRIPQDVFTWIDTYVRHPNKVLITTRSRDFKGDYPVDMTGMTEEESDALIDRTAARLDVSDVITGGYRRELYKETEGHPYVIKILLGEVAKSGRLQQVERIVATQDDVLTALFERTYAGLSPAARRLYLTLCGWRSVVPQFGVEAILLRKGNEKLDVDAAAQELLRASMIEQHVSKSDESAYLSVPLTAALFGRRKLAVSPVSAEIEGDLELLRAFGPARPTDVAAGAEVRVQRMFRAVSERVGKGELLEKYVPILEFLARRFPRGWLLLARLYEEIGSPGWTDPAKEAVRRFLESGPEGHEHLAAWRKLATLCEVSQDTVGEAHALVEITRLESVPFPTISVVASRLNGLLSGPIGLIDPQVKRVLAARVLEVMDSRVDEANAADLSRMAWLCLHLKDESKAREYTRKGLAIEPDNFHLQNLAEKLGI